VTGGSSGLGFEIAKALLARDPKVAITDHRAAVASSAVEELRKSGGTVSNAVAILNLRTPTWKRAIRRRMARASRAFDDVVPAFPLCPQIF
jgi:NAD(P)-dependent dehydrogenase (short-subunit alcohol dehydrogenase family)